MWASHFKSWTWILCEPRILILGRESHVLGYAFGFQYLVNFHCFRILTCVLFFALRYSLILWWRDVTLTMWVVSSLRRTISAFTEKNRGRQTKLSQASSLTLWELSTDERFESNGCTLLRKPDFLFRDSVNEDVEVMYDIATNGFIGSENVVSSSRTWRGCFLCHPFN